MDQSKLLELLELTWESPVFGNSYAVSKAVGSDSRLQRIERLYDLLVTQLQPIMAAWMHPITDAEIGEIIRQIAPKSTAFCSAIAAGELNDVEPLAQAGFGIALAYWVDHRIDRGDHAMEQAVRWYASQQNPLEQAWHHAPERERVRTRLVGLAALEQSIAAFARPEDVALLRHNMLHDVLCGEVRARELSRLYDPHAATMFWQAHAAELSDHARASVALLYVTSAIYAIHRRYEPQLPSLAAIWNEPAIVELLTGICSAMIRVLDDLGDREIDTGTDLAWGHFTLNMFNQAHPVWIDTFARRAGLEDQPTIDALLNAFVRDDQTGRETIAEIFVEAVRERFAALPADLHASHQLFLDLGKRVIEAGYVNVLGDIRLAGF